MSLNRIAKQKSKFAANQSKGWDEFAYSRYRAYSWRRIICLQARSSIYFTYRQRRRSRQGWWSKNDVSLSMQLWRFDVFFSLFVVAAEAWISLSTAVRIIVRRSKTFDYLIGRHTEIHYLIFRGAGRRERRKCEFPRRATGKFVVILGICECADLCVTPSLSYRLFSVLHIIHG